MLCFRHALPAPRRLAPASRPPPLRGSARPPHRGHRRRPLEGGRGDPPGGRTRPRTSAWPSAPSARRSTTSSPRARSCGARARARSSPRTTAAGSCSTSSTSCARTARGPIPEVRTASFQRGRADAAEAAALGIARDERVVRIRNVLVARRGPVIVDDITLPAALYPGLTEKIFAARDNTIYHLYQSRYGINVLRTDERLRAALATGRRGVPPRRGAGPPAPRDPPRRPHLPRPPGGAARLAREHRRARLPQHLRQGRAALRPCRPRSSSCPTSS